MIVLPKKYDPGQVAFGVQKNSPFLKILNYYMRHLIQTGVIKRILETHEIAPQICPDYSGKPLGMNSVFTAFIAPIFGLCSGLFLFMLEKIRQFKSSMPQRKIRTKRQY